MRLWVEINFANTAKQSFLIMSTISANGCETVIVNLPTNDHYVIEWLK